MLSKRRAWFLAAGGLCLAAAGCSRVALSEPLPDESLALAIRGATVSGESEQGTTETVAIDRWGTLSGRFVFDGNPPRRANITATKNTDVCGKDSPIPDESLLV